jgi:hypothetical protein
VINDAAKRLNVTPSALSNALKKALEDRVDAAVAAGRITKAEGDAIKQRIESSDFPLFFGHPRFGHAFGFFAGLDAAASYLGVTISEIRSDLESGQTLAQVARDKGKSVGGLINVMYDAAKQRLDAAVSAGRLTQSDEDKILPDVKQRITDFVNGAQPGGTYFFRGRPGLFRPGGGNFFRAPFGGPPDGFRRYDDF